MGHGKDDEHSAAAGDHGPGTARARQGASAGGLYSHTERGVRAQERRRGEESEDEVASLRRFDVDALEDKRAAKLVNASLAVGYGGPDTALGYPLDQSQATPAGMAGGTRPSAQFVLNKVILVSTSVLLGAFFVHWIADHALIWQGPELPTQAVSDALRRHPSPSLNHARPLTICPKQATTRGSTMLPASTASP